MAAYSAKQAQALFLACMQRCLAHNDQPGLKTYCHHRGLQRLSSSA